MFKIIYILTIIFYWLSFAASYVEIKKNAQRKIAPLRQFAISCTGKPLRFSSLNIPAILLNLFKSGLFSLVPILNICMGLAYTREDFQIDMVNRLTEDYKKKYTDWLADNCLEQDFIEYTQGG